MLKKARSFMKTKAEKMKKAATPMLVAGAAMGIAPTVYAGGTDINANDVIGKVVSVVLDIFMYIGIILALWGMGSLILAFKNEDADSKSRAIMSLVVGIALVTFKTLFGGVIEQLGITIS